MAEFRHVHAAHCESGATAALLGHAGLEISEPMAFGLGSGIFFFYPPLIRVVGMPLISFRSYPGKIFELTCKRLGVQTTRKKFVQQSRGVTELDGLLARGIPVGLQTNMFWLSYFPKEFRSQFNGHNLIALARRGDIYSISDPVLQDPVEIHAESLQRARFAKGVLSPRGFLYYPQPITHQVDIAGAIPGAVAHNADWMLKRAPMIGVRGIRRLANHVRSWGQLADEKRRKLLIGHVIRMQEEVGTGGAGFRFLYAAFLQEAGELLDHAPYREASTQMTAAGDVWRGEFARICGRIIKDRTETADNLDQAAEALIDCARKEEAIFRFLLQSPKPHRTTVTPLAAASSSP